MKKKYVAQVVITVEQKGKMPSKSAIHDWLEEIIDRGLEDENHADDPKGWEVNVLKDIDLA